MSRGVEANGAGGRAPAATRREMLAWGVGGLLTAGLAGSAGAQAIGPAVLQTVRRQPAAPPSPGLARINPILLERAKAALARNPRVTQRDVIAIADYGRPSSLPRFHIVDFVGGRSTDFLVAHGRGSDPEHLGWLQYWSNSFGSLASSRGTYLTGERYTGRYGLSVRLDGLDYTNDLARERAIVVHGADYVGPHMNVYYGKMGRSEGCFAVPNQDLYGVMARLGPGHMIYADKI